MKRLNITKEQFNRSNYFQKKYGKLEYVSESGKLFKTTKGRVLKFKESTKKLVKEAYNRKLGVVKLDSVGLPREGKLEVTCRCPFCKQDHSFITKETDFMYGWHLYQQNGATIQDAWPDLSPDEREMVKTGICPKCWEAAFGGEEDDEPANESRKLVKEGAGAGYTVTIKGLKFGKILDKKLVEVKGDPFGCYECKVEILPGEYEIGAEDYYNDFFWQEHEWGDTPKAKIDGGVATVVYSKQWRDDEQAEEDLREQVENIELDISFDYGGGWIHVALPREKIAADHVDVGNSGYYAGILDIELNAPDLADAVNSGYASLDDRNNDEDDEEI